MRIGGGEIRRGIGHELDRKKWRIIGLGAVAAVVALSIGGALWVEAPHTSQGPKTTPGATVSPPATPEKEPNRMEYPVHSDITATIFWVGEAADDSNDYIHNRSSAWTADWVAAFGGVDDPERRCDFKPCGFTPKENPFYFALPFGDYTETGMKPAAELAVIPWYDSSVQSGGSLLKNRWIEVTTGKKTVYAQWEDVGPFESDDAGYVFGGQRPKETRAGLDLSPAAGAYLGIGGRGKVSWRFVEEAQVPGGPWRETITRSSPQN